MQHTRVEIIYKCIQMKLNRIIEGKYTSHRHPNFSITKGNWKIIFNWIEIYFHFHIYSILWCSFVSFNEMFLCIADEPDVLDSQRWGRNSRKKEWMMRTVCPGYYYVNKLFTPGFFSHGISSWSLVTPLSCFLHLNKRIYANDVWIFSLEIFELASRARDSLMHSI